MQAPLVSLLGIAVDATVLSTHIDGQRNMLGTNMDVLEEHDFTEEAIPTVAKLTAII